MVFVLVGCVLPATVWKQPSAQTIKQPAEVVEAYQVCNRFQEVFVDTLDFDRAFEATFTRNVSRRRETAIAEGQFGDLDLARVDTATLVSAYKSRMQILFLMLPLLSAETKAEKARFFPPVIQEILDRKAPKMPEGFNSYAIQLKDDATTFRAHLDRLAKEHPHIAEQIRQFKAETKKLELPTNYVVKPLTAYSRGQVLETDEQYYRIDGFAVIRENG